MVVAVAAVRVVQMVPDEIVHMVAMRQCVVAAPRSVDMTGVVRSTNVLGRARVRVARGHGDRVIVDVVAVRVMQATVVQEIDVPLVDDHRVPATGTMDMVMCVVLCHAAKGTARASRGRDPADGSTVGQRPAG